MTRLFLDDGRHVPVTVLKLDGCQVVSTRTEDKDGYTAVQLGSGFAKAKNLTKADRGNFAKAEVEPKRKLAEFRVDAGNMLEVGDTLKADHFVPGQKVDVTGVNHRPRLHRRDEAVEFPRSRSVARRVDLASISWRNRWPPGSGQDLQEQEDARPLRRGTM